MHRAIISHIFDIGGHRIWWAIPRNDAPGGGYLADGWAYTEASARRALAAAAERLDVMLAPPVVDTSSASD